MSNNYFSFRAFHETQMQIKEEKIQKAATLLSMVENPEEFETQAAIFDEVDLDPLTLSLDDLVLLEKLSGVEILFENI